MSPSQRAMNKRGITIYIDEKLYKRFQDACAFFGLPMSTTLTAYMETKAEEYEKLQRDQQCCSRRAESDKGPNQQDWKDSQG